MSTYRNIHGRSIKSISTDPTAEVTEGEIWYNTTSETFKTVVLSESWSSGNSMATGRYNLAGSGTQTAGLIAGGTTPGIVTNTEHYDGIGWRNGGALNTGRDSAPMFGFSTAAVFAGGYAPSPNGARALVEEYNGTAWSEETDLPTPRYQGASAGTQTDGILFGGNQGPPGSPETTSTTTLEYNGTNWTTGGAMSVNDRYLMGCGGSQAQALRIGGEADTDATEEYNGSSWTTGGNLNTGRYQGAASGTNTAGLVFVGNPNRTNTEGYDGTSWSVKPVLGTGVEDTSGSAQGTNTEAFQAGQSASPTSVVQNWNSSVNVITAAAWSSGTSYPAAYQGGIGFGSATAGVGAGGTPSPTFNLKTFEYDGTVWTAGNDMSRASGSPYTSAYSSGSGTQTAGWAAGGGYPSENALTENYNGTNWTASAAMPASRRGVNCTAPQTAGLVFGGYDGSNSVNTTYEYDGEAWTTGGTLGAATRNAGGSGPTGSQDAALAVAGNGSPPSQINTVQEYNGSSWTTVNSYPISVSYLGYAGSQTDAIMFMGYTSPGPSFTSTFAYDGTNWSTRPNASTGRLNYHNNFGTATAAVVFGGEAAPGITAATEEFTGETGSLNVKTLTQS